MQPKQNLGEKFINDYLFATSKDLDKYGRNPHGSVVNNVLAMPELKIGGLVTLPLSIAFAAAGSHLTALIDLGVYALALSAGPMILSEEKRQNEQDESFGNNLTYLFNPSLRWILSGAAKKEYYFDTNPSIKQPIPEDIFPVLKRDKFLAQTCLGLSVVPPLLAPYIASITFPSLIPNVISLSAVFIASKSPYFGAKWWRIDQALKGNWNVTTERPEKAPAPETIATPVLSRG